MLLEKDALKTETKIYKFRKIKGTYKITVFYFKCNNCQRLIKVQKKNLENHRGFCISCGKKKKDPKNLPWPKCNFKENDVIKIETRTIKNQKYTRPVYIYHFKCKKCPSLVKVSRAYLSISTGLCRSCVSKGIPFLGLFNHMKSTAIRHDKEFVLSFKEFLEFTKIGRCYYCNAKLIWQPHSGKCNHRYNLDRKDSSIGYIKYNLVTCCKRCNWLKSDKFSYKEFLEIVKLLDKLRGGTFITKL